jgi:hypothetical protein
MIDLGATTRPSNLRILLERSQPCALHIFLPSVASHEQLAVLSSAADRIICMTISDCRFLQNQFPLLERLELTVGPGAYRNTDDDRQGLSEASSFPQLRQLCLVGVSTHALCQVSVPRNGFAGLEKLEIMCGHPPHWLRIVQSVSNTLVSLVLHLFYHPDHPTYNFSFPRLRHLEITKKYDPILLVLDLDAPRLESIDEGIGINERNDTHTMIRLRNPKSVKQLRSGCFPLNLTHYPALRKLWISDNTEYTQTMLRSLKGQIASCPELKAVLYCDHSRHAETTNGPYLYRRPAPVFPAIVDLVRRTGRAITVREFLPNELDLPGAMQQSVSILLTVILLSS